MFFITLSFLILTRSFGQQLCSSRVGQALKYQKAISLLGPFFRLANRYVSWFMVDLFVSLAVIGGVAIVWRTQMPLNWG